MSNERSTSAIGEHSHSTRSRATLLDNGGSQIGADFSVTLNATDASSSDDEIQHNTSAATSIASSDTSVSSNTPTNPTTAMVTASPDGTTKPTADGVLTLLAACGITDAGQQRCLRDTQGLRCCADWLDMSTDDFASIARAATKLPPSAGTATSATVGPFSISVVTIKRMIALRAWTRDAVLTGGTMDAIRPGDFTGRAIRDHMRISTKSTSDLDIDKPDPLTDTKNWVRFREHLLACLQSTTGEQECPLACIVRVDRDEPASLANKTREEKIFWSAPHTGCGFELDDTTAFQPLQTLLEKCSCSHILAAHKPSRNAVAAWKDLTDLCDGAGEITKRSVTAGAALKATECHDENTKEFTALVAEVSGMHETLRMSRAPIAASEQVNILCDDILKGVTNVDARTAMSDAGTRFPEDFARACNVISTAICRALPRTDGKRSVSTTNTSVDTSDWNTCDTKCYCNGVDVRHVLNPNTPNMPKDDWNRLPDAVRIAISNERRHRREKQADDTSKRTASETKKRKKRKGRRVQID